MSRWRSQGLDGVSRTFGKARLTSLPALGKWYLWLLSHLFLCFALFRHANSVHNVEFFVLELNRSLSDLEDEIEWIDDDDWFFNTTPEPPLRRLVESPDCLAFFEPLLDITESEQARALGAMEDASPKPGKKAPVHDESVPRQFRPDESFAALSKPMRKFLKQYCDTEMCREVDTHLRQLLQSEHAGTDFLWRDPFQRKLGHALSKYYRLSSYSKDAADGRITVVTKTHHRLFPLVALPDFLLED